MFSLNWKSVWFLKQDCQNMSIRSPVHSKGSENILPENCFWLHSHQRHSDAGASGVTLWSGGARSVMHPGCSTLKWTQRLIGCMKRGRTELCRANKVFIRLSALLEAVPVSWDRLNRLSDTRSRWSHVSWVWIIKGGLPFLQDQAVLLPWLDPGLPCRRVVSVHMFGSPQFQVRPVGAFN